MKQETNNAGFKRTQDGPMALNLASSYEKKLSYSLPVNGKNIRSDLFLTH